MPRSKNILEDIKPLTRQSAPATRARRARVQEEDIAEEVDIETEDDMDYVPPVHVRRHHAPRRRRVFPSTGWIVVVVLTLGGLIGGSLLFTRAEVSIDRKSELGELDGLRLTAMKGDAETVALPFEVMSLEGDVSKTLVATKKEDAKIAATGRVVIFNDFTSTPQKLIANTRLETKDGKIYRIQSAVTVPGKKGSTPGSVEVDIKADVAGSSYNAEFADLFITGFKGTPKYKGFYARTKGAISGGREGEKYVVSGEPVTTAKTALSAELREKLLRDAKSQVPEGYVLFDDTVTISESASSDSVFYADTQDVAVASKGTLTGVLLPVDTLSKVIAKKTLSQYDDAPVYIANLDALTVKFAKTYSDLKNTNEIEFVFTGSAQINWTIDEDAITTALLGKPKKEFNDIMRGFVSVHSAELHLRPFWMPKVPTKHDKVHIVIEQAQPMIQE
jgi:hypothetical protein